MTVIAGTPNPKTVVFLGAGASVCAGYPTGISLLPTIKSDAENSSLVSYRELWANWAKYTAQVEKALKSDDPLARLILNPNPEVALSVIDLMEVTLKGEDERMQDAGFAQAAVDLRQGMEMIERHYRGSGRKILQEPGVARNSLIQAMDWYFVQKHAALRQRPAASRNYLRAVLDDVGFAPGDVIVTTNWDAVAELTLGEGGMWNPFDGYGFARKLVNGRTGPDGKPKAFPDRMPRTSPVKVLKLHGSFGWRETNGRLTLDYDHFLYQLSFAFNADTLVFRDVTNRVSLGYQESLYLYPSFLKRIRTPELHEVWYLASEAIRSCEKFVAVGYSLPDADSAVRTLLLPLRFKALEGRVKVDVYDPSAKTLAAWQDFVEGNAQDHRGSICDVFGEAPTLLP